MCCCVSCSCIEATLASEVPLPCCQADDFKSPCQSYTVCSIAVSCSSQARVQVFGLDPDVQGLIIQKSNLQLVIPQLWPVGA